MDKVYIAGPITGHANYKKAFSYEAKKWARKGYIILNPAVLPEGMGAEDYMRICLPMLMAADYVVFLPGWEKSGGASIEHALAEYLRKGVLYAGNAD